MKYQKHTLSNGVRIVMFPVPGVESVTTQIFVGSGTKQENPRVNGLAHFLEHMVFKGTKKYPDAQIVSGSVDAVGGYINAHTSKEVVAYYIKSRAKHINLSLDLLSDFIKSPILDKDEIEREKGVILEEIAMYEDEPARRVYDLFEELMFEDTPLGMPEAGVKKTVLAAKRKDFLDYMAKNYTADNIVLAIAGKFNEKEVLTLAKAALGDLPKSKSNKASKTVYKQANPSGKLAIRVMRKKTEQAQVVLGFRGNPLGHKDRYIEMVLASILGGGMSSRLFTEVRERRGLAYSIRCNVDHYVEAGYVAVRAGIKLTGVEEAIKVIMSELEKIKDAQSISPEEQDKAKEYLKGRYALGLEDTHAVAEFYGEQELLQGRVRMLPEIVEGINAVTAEEVSKLARKIFVKERLNLAVIGPYNTPSRFEKLLA